jgi:hypothetical protein
VPAPTIWPGVRLTARTVPETSFCSVIERSAVTVPIAVVM